MAPRKKISGDDIEALLGADKPSQDELASVAELTDKAIKLQAEIQRRTEIVAKQNEELNDLLINKIPAAMAQARMTKFTLDSGVIIEVKDFLHGSLPKEDPAKRKAAIAWLVKNGGKDLVRTAIATSFGAGEAAQAKRVLDAIKALKIKGLLIDQKQDVHPSSLKAFARERMRAGAEVPLDTLGLFAGRMAAFKLPATPR